MWQTILLALCCCCGSTISTDVDGIHFKEIGFVGAPKGDPMVQRITPANCTWIDGIFYDEPADNMYFVDRHGNRSVSSWNYRSGLITLHLIFYPEELAFFMPIKGSKTDFILGSNLNIRKVQLQADDSLGGSDSEPLITFDELEPGSKMWAAKADRAGRLFIVIVNHVKMEQKLYKIENKNSVLVYSFNNGVNSIAWNKDFSKMYILAYQELMEFDYDIKDGTIANKNTIYSMDDVVYKINGMKFKGISIDEDNGVWFGVEPASIIGNLIYNGSAWEVNLAIKQVGLPTTSYGFGGYRNKNILVGTHKTKECVSRNPYAGYGSIFLTSGLNVTGVPYYKPVLD